MTLTVVAVSLAAAAVIVPRVLFRGVGWIRQHLGIDETAVSMPLGPVIRTIQFVIFVLEARFWIDQPNPFRRPRVTAEVVEAIKAAYDEAGIAITFPQRTVGQRAQADVEGPRPAE